MNQLAHRRAQAPLRILNPDGTPAAGAVVQFGQTQHDFLFGCGGFEVSEYMRCQDPARRAFLETRMNQWLGVFNYATIPFYWGTYEPVEGRPDFEPTMRAARWFRDRGVVLKGHPLCWHTVCADWLMRYDNQAIFDKQIARIHRDVTAFRGVIDKWDVINEVVIMPIFDKYDNAVTRLCRQWGQVGLVKAVFEAALEANPSGQFLINDFNTTPAYEELLSRLLDAGVPIRVIGIQSHQHQGYWGLEKLNDVLYRFSRFGLPLHFTENTILSGALTPPEYDDLNDWAPVPWDSTPEGEIRQAEQMAEFYTALFGHPSVEAITTWNMTDDGWLQAPGGIIAKDNREKPAYKALRDLIHGAWETHVELVADENGVVVLDGFKGRYTASTPAGRAELHLSDGAEQVIRLK